MHFFERAASDKLHLWWTKPGMENETLVQAYTDDPGNGYPQFPGVKANIYLYAGTNHGATPGQHCDYANIKIREASSPSSTTTECNDLTGPNNEPWHDTYYNPENEEWPYHNCAWYAHQSNCYQWGDSSGTPLTANEACCVCGGGTIGGGTGMRRGGRIRSLPGGRGKKMARGGRTSVGYKPAIRRGGRTRPLPRGRMRRR